MSGGDENTARDMGVLVTNAEKLAARFGCIVILVHHAGKTADRGSRGSNSLDGAADVMWFVDKGEAESRVSITAMKDSESGLDWTFRLQTYWFDDDDQSRNNTCTVEILSEPTAAKPRGEQTKPKALPKGGTDRPAGAQ